MARWDKWTARLGCLGTVLLLVLAPTTTTALTTDDLLDCQPEWFLIGYKCYRFFPDMLPWDSADRVCQSYGSQLVKVKDFYENEDIGKFAQSNGSTEYWLGVSRKGIPTSDQERQVWTDGSKGAVHMGHWHNDQPDRDKGLCVLASKDMERVLWSYAPCEKKSTFICQRNAAPKGSFHCHNGNFVRTGLKCDGEDDCGDGSDELECNSRCSYHFKNQMSGNIQSPNYSSNYPDNKVCSWLIELPVGYNVKLQFTEFRTESQLDVVVILGGGQTVSTSRMMAQLSGILNSPLPSYTSINNFLMVTFSSDGSRPFKGFSASFSAEKQTNLQPLNHLTATATRQELVSPFYPMYLSSQDYTWIITAKHKTKIITLEIGEVDLKGSDKILIRDGDKASDALLAQLTASDPNPAYVLSTGQKMYITMQIRGMERGKGFKFYFWEGCSISLSGKSGEIHSPGFGTGNYSAYQKCYYNVSAGVPITVRVDSMKIHKSDQLLIYEGSALLQNLSETNSPAPFNISSGTFSAVFDSDAILTDEGFKLTFSVACTDPQFNGYTVLTPPLSSYRLGTKTMVSCVTGYAFNAQQFLNLDSVQLECMPGGNWNLPILPVCQPKYCGKAPAVTNAYVMNSTGVTYMGTVAYSCYPGFAMTGGETIRCTENGTWTDTPTCQSSSCSALPSVNKATKLIQRGDGRGFSTIVEYRCEAGYQIVGEPLLFCQSDGKWSASVPSCEVLNCYVPESIPNGRLDKGGKMIKVGETVQVSCDDGYKSNAASGGAMSLSCEVDRSLQGLGNFNCSYTNKCNAEPSYCDHHCQDSEFRNRTCSCKDGYTLAQDMKSCQNIDECKTNNGGCDQTCTDTVGGYKCSCKEGYILFMTEGVEGYYLAPREDGMKPGDVRRFNHTCLRVQCTAPPVVANGTLLIAEDSYYYGDSVEYMCVLGFEMKGTSLLTCNKDGKWDSPAPRCSPAMCDLGTVSGQNPATVSPNGTVLFGEMVTLTCNVPGKPVYTTSRHCIYHDQKYQLVGADYDCGFIDCKQPETMTGSNYTGSVTSTTYGSSFVFGCQDLFSIEGQSEESKNRTVRCTSRGQWDFGSLRCAGVTCQDPGRPPDGRQINSPSYDQGSLVYFKCDRSGFVLSNPYPLQCQLSADGRGLEWNSSIPSCVDNEKPVLTNCPPQSLSVERYKRASDVVTLPVATDNVGVKTYEVVDRAEIRSWPSDDFILSQLFTFNFSVTDYAGKEVSCYTTISIIDGIPPVLECPDKIVKEFSKENETINVQFTSADLKTLKNHDGNQPMFIPSGINDNVQNLIRSSFPHYRSYNVMVDVKDAAGNNASCQFELSFKANDCSPFTLREPLHGSKSCQATSTGFQCVLSCDSGYVFYDYPGSANLTYTCAANTPWTAPVIPACVKANETSQLARFRQIFRYTFNKNVSQNCAVLANVQSVFNIAGAQGALPKPCSIGLYNFDGVLSFTDVTEDTDKIYVNVTLTYKVGTSEGYGFCSPYLRTKFEDATSNVNSFFKGVFNPLTCPIISNSDGAKLVLQEYFCTAGKKVQYKPEGTSSTADVCVSCPEGTQKTSDSCELCPEGTFNPTPDTAGCSKCADGTSTFRPGAVTNGECTALCGSGKYSSTGLPPCSMCPKNTFSVNSTFCEPCPAGHTTRNTGATSAAQCLPPCLEGTYNPIDGHGYNCSKCPRHFYADKKGSVRCTECSGSHATDSEGSTSAAQCLLTGCSKSNPCQNGGTCSTSRHVANCACVDGYKGRFCEEVNPCASNPCYFNGTCTPNGVQPKCSCKTGTTGDLCEQIVGSCTPDYCQNGGACRNELNNKTCLCRPAFSGDTCQIRSDICKSDSCKNGGNCTSLENVRFRCDCPSGYEGPLCETSIDDCASNPCLHGGNCTDKLSDFECSCPVGFSGKRCENRPQLCATANCGRGTCVEDYEAATYRCICPEGNYYGTVCQYEISMGQDLKVPSQTVYNSSGMSIQQCMAKCEELSCQAFLFNRATSDCWVYNTASLSLQPGTLVYYKRVCSKVKENFWTPWYDTSDPKTNDDEQVGALNSFGLNICQGSKAVAAECRVVGSKAAPTESLAVSCTPSQGLLCSNNQQADKQCEDYEIRFKCLSLRVLSKSACEDIQYCSVGGVCKNGGACSENQTQPLCSCSTGFTGSLCQHSEKDCSSTPCMNGGSCADTPSGFNCTCLPGLEGDRCETNVDECSPNPCDATGSTSCMDLVNRYECRCKAGFTGRHCQTNINECASQPCLHNGTCQDGVNDFTCTCKPGWTGKMCDSLVTQCTSRPCKQGAPCSNLFNDYYCSCHPNMFGRVCDIAPGVCNNANPCLHGSNCTEDMGVAQCQCSREFLGEGCQIQRDMCSKTEPQCRNGATCSISQGKFSCLCAAGYRGQFCEENIDDCQGKSCPATSTCIDMVNQHFCRCPVGKSGEDCTKDTDKNFDLMFSSPDKTSMAALVYPLHLNGSGFSITMWIQHLQKGDTGTFFTLYKISDPNSLSGKEELVRVDHTGATVSLNNHTVLITSFVKYNADVLWHYIAITWSKDTGLLTFFVDTIRKTYTFPEKNRGMSLDMSVWMVLGCRYDPGTDKCVKDQGSRSVISQVTLYHRELKFDEELTRVGNEQPYAIFPDAVMAWGEFVQYPGVTCMYPSQVNKACAPGFTDYGTCIEPAPGKRRVSIDQNSCPNDIIKHGVSRVTKVEWELVKFSGQVHNIQLLRKPGVLLLWGKYPVVVVGTNRDDNKALCTFDIYIRYNQCEDLSKPASSKTLYCSVFTDEGKRPYKYCSTSCLDNFAQVIPSPKIHTCGPVGSWDPPNRYLPYNIPPCGASSTPKHRLVVKMLYHLRSTECPHLEKHLPDQIRARLWSQSSKWTPPLCKSNDCSDIQLKTVCTPIPSSTDRKIDIEITITADDVAKEVKKVGDDSVSLSPRDVLQLLILSDTVFNLEESVAGAILDPEGLVAQTQLLCQAPLTLSGDRCVECSSGSYYNDSTKACALCPIGQYQPQSNQVSCQSCNAGDITETVGSTSAGQCKKICPAGEYFHKASGACDQCPQGYYQDTPGLFYCLPCPVDRTTRQKGAKSASVCFSDCLPGQDLSENGTCIPCAIGFYKPSGPTVCIKCPVSLVTNETGADSLDDCNVADNPPGYIRSRANETQQVPCPRGTYQPKPWQYNCISCGGDRYRTDSEGSTKKEQCKFFCPAGQQKVDQKEECEPCPIGAFRTGSNPYSSCESCPNKTRTPNVGSTSAANCSIMYCSEGYKISGSVCEPCPKGSYQDQPYQSKCQPCTGQRSTRQEASTSANQCETYCDAGSEKKGGACSVCPRGYYKSNDQDVFMQCTLCPLDMVTPAAASISQDNCTVPNCTEGYFIQGKGCELCDFGEYQPLKWQPACSKCDTNKNTTRKGAVSKAECHLSCPLGQENPSNTENCTLCPQGKYKDEVGATTCSLCPTGNVTRSIGATAVTDCNLRACTAGNFANNSHGGECSPCDYGKYQPNKWQERCIQCKSGLTTYRTGADKEDFCLKDCKAGEELSTTSNSCKPCPVGYYNDDTNKTASTCTMCPPDYITLSTSATSSTDCKIRNCTKPGQYRDSNKNSCEDCPFGQWQDQKWQPSCKPCATGYTTKNMGSSSQSDCKLDCASGQHLVGGSCVECERGYYRDKSQSWDCQQCPKDLTTQAKGATSKQECSVSTCTAGQYFSSNAKSCKQCEENTYQDKSGQSLCLPCPDGLETRQPGAASRDLCIDKCDKYNGFCDKSAICIKGKPNITCVCKEGYIGNGTTCKHMCDVENYCQNKATCNRALFKCECTDKYEGEFCERRADVAKALSDKDVIIIASITTLAFLLFLILLIVCCILNYRKKQKNKTPYNNDTMDERTSFATRLSTRGFEDFGGGWTSKAPSVSGGRMVIPAHAQQMYENPTYTLNDVDAAVYKI